MRKLKRSIARHNMQLAGITRFNKKKVADKKSDKKSFFALHWQEYAAKNPARPRRRSREARL